jgi:SAM-dependent methyltransferase
MDHAKLPDLAPADATDRSTLCLFCGGKTKIRDRLPRIWHNPVGSQSYDIRWCESCDFGFLDPCPSPEEHARMARAAREISRDWPELIPAKTTFLEKVRGHLAWRVTHANARPLDAALIDRIAGGRPLSICVFSGFFSPALDHMMQELQNSGQRVVGVVSAPADPGTMPARSRFFHHGSIEEPPAAILAETFDLVVMSWVLHSCRHPRQALQNAHKLLKPGGHLMADVPNNGAYTARRLRSAWYFCDAGSTLCFFTDQSLSRLLETAGFEIVDHIFCNYTVQFRNSRLAIEQTLWDRLYENVVPGTVKPPRRKSQWEIWRGLFGSMFRKPAEKYEVAGIIGKKRAE